jgi:hypothetical protein
MHRINVLQNKLVMKNLKYLYLLVFECFEFSFLQKARHRLFDILSTVPADV